MDSVNMTHELAIQANETLKELLEFEDAIEMVNMSSPSDTIFAALEFSKMFHYVMAVLGIIGNLLIIAIYIKFARIRTVTITYIFNIAISDLLYVITVPVFLISIWNNSWPFGDLMCRLLLSKGAVHRFASSLFLLVVVGDTYLSILKPTLSHTLYKKSYNVKLITVFTWIVCIASVVPVFYHASIYHVPNTDINHCDLFWTGPSREHYIWFTIILAFLLPTILKLLLAIPIIYQLSGSGTVESNGQYLPFAERNKRSAHLVLTVTLFHIVFWLPLWVSLISINLMPVTEQPDTSSILFHMISGCIGMVNTVINPILYIKLSPDFRNGLHDLITCIPESLLAKDPVNNSEVMNERSNRNSDTNNITKFESAMANIN
ncbi:somatostatin receptor type 2-like [Oppia nitens]|uniref:somatostatin receptor type 2-like n=1 Tax=Oppia nitens TaxID=1686743 RepID=UPI0023DCE289|nr:somatostatin receptor type 2-like [Oppia nitens]